MPKFKQSNKSGGGEKGPLSQRYHQVRQSNAESSKKLNIVFSATGSIAIEQVTPKEPIPVQFDQKPEKSATKMSRNF